MVKDLIRYDLLVQDALKGVVKKVLGDAARHGLQGDHHFYVSFLTGHPGVHLSSRLREKYPQEMTIIIQHQFWDMNVGDNAFEIGLSFSNIPERLHIPYDALTGFFDPSVQFGLKFNSAEEEEGSDGPIPLDTEFARKSRENAQRAAEQTDNETILTASEASKNDAAPETDEDSKNKKQGKEHSGADVVSLDAFRKK